MSKKRGFSPSSSSRAPSLAPSPLRTGLEGLPSSRTPLLRPSPLRTVHASFPARGSSTANASFRETRLRDGKVLTVNPVVALRMKEDAVFDAFRATLHERNAVVKAP